MVSVGLESFLSALEEQGCSDLALLHSFSIPDLADLLCNDVGMTDAQCKAFMLSRVLLPAGDD